MIPYLSIVWGSGSNTSILVCFYSSDFCFLLWLQVENFTTKADPHKNPSGFAVILVHVSLHASNKIYMLLYIQFWWMKIQPCPFFLLTGKGEVPWASHWRIWEHANGFYWNVKGRKSWKSYCKSVKISCSWETAQGNVILSNGFNSLIKSYDQYVSIILLDVWRSELLLIMWLISLSVFKLLCSWRNWELLPRATHNKVP